MTLWIVALLLGAAALTEAFGIYRFGWSSLQCKHPSETSTVYPYRGGTCSLSSHDGELAVRNEETAQTETEFLEFNNGFCVQKKRKFPVSPAEAHEAWRTHHWNRGGGLPLVPRTDKQQQRRVLFPLLLEETIQTDQEDRNSDDNESIEIRYDMTGLGPLGLELLSTPHVTVRLESQQQQEQNNGNHACLLTWRVEVTARHPDMARRVIEFVLHSSLNYLEAAVSLPPRLLTRRLVLRGKNISPGTALEKWIHFVWNEGGGLPLPLKPIHQRDSHKQQRLIVPPFLSESIINTTDDHQVYYQVDNPGWFTYPVYTHLGRVTFVESSNDDDAVEMLWEVEIRPYPLVAPLTEAFTESVITTISRNLAVHVSDGPDAMVQVSPPRGKGESFAQVRKDSWLGGVLESHLRDKRSTLEQTMAMLQPWTWGRASDHDNGEGSVEWSNGHLPKR